MAKEKEDFIIADRRKFTSEGDLRSDAPVESAKELEPQKETGPAESDAPPTMPPPPTAAEQDAQHRDYADAGKKIDSILEGAGHKRPPQMEVTFERLIVSLYMQTMAQLGMVREEGSEPQPDLIGARHTIDTIALLGDKTKGNLNERESGMLQNCLFELRMAFLQITNALTAPAAPPSPPKK